MFLASERILDVPCHAARARLVNLVHGGGLNLASHAAYQHGLDGVIRVGPLGNKPGASKLVGVRFLDPVERDGVMMVGLRWEATGAAAGLFRSWMPTSSSGPMASAGQHPGQPSCS
jgi:hypothetical protein